MAKGDASWQDDFDVDKDFFGHKTSTKEAISALFDGGLKPKTLLNWDDDDHDCGTPGV